MGGNLTKTLRSYHLRAKFLKERHGHGYYKDAWIQVETEYFELTGKFRYTSYDSFRNHHTIFIARLKNR
jgi:hypothetical protein